MSPKEYYLHRSKDLSLELKELQSRSNRFVVLRLGLFLCIPLSVYVLFSNLYLATAVSLLILASFLFVVRKSVDLKNNILFYKSLIKINDDELNVLSGDFSAFHNGQEFMDPSHPNSYDMDVFGEKGIFQYLNRTISLKGRELLANYLKNGIEKLDAHHQTIKNLILDIEWTQAFRAKGMRDENIDERYIDSWISEKLNLSKIVSVGRFLLPTLAFGGLIALITNTISDAQFTYLVIACLIPVLTNLKATNAEAEKLSRIKGRIQTIRSQISLLHELKVESELINESKEILFKEAGNAEEALNKLIKIQEKFDLRLNFLVSILFNIFIAYDFQLMSALYKWRKTYAHKIESWEVELLKMEVYISQMNFYYNYENHTCFPSISQNENSPINIQELGHPLLLSSKMVRNDFNLSTEENFVIVTGPNMAGKSTFLRSVGVNLILANAGFTVVAKTFNFPRLTLYSSMRTADNLTEESSYFHAELIRLRFIVDAIKRGEKVFIVLDEILKGTNSKDKEEGSAKFLRKLISLNTKGIIATHDLSLTALANNNPTIINQYFDSTIEGENISFSYKINQGVVKNMNASFLLKQMKLVD